MVTCGNSFRINNLEIKNKKSIICIHDAPYVSQCIELEKAFAGKYPFGYTGTSPWLGGTENAIPLSKENSVNQEIIKLLAQQSDVGVVLYYIDGTPHELESFFAFTRTCFSNSLHLLCAGMVTDEVCLKNGFSKMSGMSTEEIVAFCTDYIDAAEPPQFVQVQNREHAEWANFSFSTFFHPQRALLVGDSISCGYGWMVADIMTDYSVDLLNTSEGTAHDNIFRELDIMMSCHHYDVIHINNGIHLHMVSNEDYGRNLDKIFSYIREKSPDTKIIFATTTTVSKKPEPIGDYRTDDFQLGDRKPYDELAENPYTEYDEQASARYIELNSVARAVCDRTGVSINDLFKICLEYNPPKRDFVHFGDSGYQLLADAVADSIFSCGRA